MQTNELLKLREALQRIADMDADGVRADDLGRAARTAREALSALSQHEQAELPPLPEPAYPAGTTGMLGEHCFAADQMRERDAMWLERIASLTVPQQA